MSTVVYFSDMIRLRIQYHNILVFVCVSIMVLGSLWSLPAWTSPAYSQTSECDDRTATSSAQNRVTNIDSTEQAIDIVSDISLKQAFQQSVAPNIGLTSDEARVRLGKLETSGVEASDPLDEMPETAAADAEVIHVTVSACGSRMSQGLDCITTVSYFTRHDPVHFYVFTDNATIVEFHAQLVLLARRFPHHQYSLLEAKFPSDQWRNMFAPCASLRLFLPELLPRVAWTIYLDSDTVALASLATLWRHHLAANSTQAIGTCPMRFRLRMPHYSHRAGLIPYVQPWSLNSGVLLLSPARLHAANVTRLFMRYYAENRRHIRLPDQDVLNLVLSRHPELHLPLPATFNYRKGLCADCSGAGRRRAAEEAAACLELAATGATVLHGAAGAFEEDDRSCEACSLVYHVRTFVLQRISSGSQQPDSTTAASYNMTVPSSLHQCLQSLLQNLDRDFKQTLSIQIQ